MKDIKKILVPVDFSENSTKILTSAVYFANKFSATLTIVYVLQSFEDYEGFFIPHMPIAQFENEMFENAKGKMESFVRENLAPDIPHESMVLCGDVAEELVNFAGNNAIDLIVMGTHGYKGLEQILFGSVASSVVKTAPCPVMIVNPYK